MSYTFTEIVSAQTAGSNGCTSANCVDQNTGNYNAPIFVPLADYNKSQKFKDAFNSGSLSDYLNNIFTIVISIGGILAVLRIAYAGYLYMGSAGMWSTKEKAKEILGDAIIGLLLLFAIYLILNLINPDLLKLDINLQKSGVIIRADSTLNPNLALPHLPAAIQPLRNPAGRRQGTLNQININAASGQPGIAGTPSGGTVGGRGLVDVLLFSSVGDISPGSWCYYLSNNGYGCVSDQSTCISVATADPVAKHYEGLRDCNQFF